jgi:hypothetical protein
MKRLLRGPVHRLVVYEEHDGWVATCSCGDWYHWAEAQNEVALEILMHLGAEDPRRPLL